MKHSIVFEYCSKPDNRLFEKAMKAFVQYNIQRKSLCICRFCDTIYKFHLAIMQQFPITMDDKQPHKSVNYFSKLFL